MNSDQNNGFIDQLGRGLGGLFRFIIRLLFVLVLAVALGAGLYFGIAYGLPALDRAYLQPVRDNTRAVADLEARADQQAEQQATQMAGLQERVTALEVQNDTNLDNLAAIQAQLDELAPLATEQAALVEQLDQLDRALTELDSTLTTGQTSIETEVSSLQDALSENQQAITDIQAELDSNDFPFDQAYADLQIVKAMALLTRAQVFLFQNNLGLATQDVTQARDLLIALDQDPALDGMDLAPVLNRLSLALSSLPLNPNLAASDLEVAWDLLVAGVEVAAPATPAPEATTAP